jgi:hypothetical protein
MCRNKRKNFDTSKVDSIKFPKLIKWNQIDEHQGGYIN